MSQVSKILLVIGGVSGILNAISEFAFQQSLATLLGLFTLNLGMYIYGLALLALIGSLMIFYFGLIKSNKKLASAGSILALISLCGLAILALIGALLMEE